MSEASAHRVVVVGGGFGGLQAVLRLRRAPVEVTLVDRRNFHLFQPLTYQVATGALAPGEIAFPLRAIFKRDRNVRVLMAEVADFDLEARKLHLRPVAGVPAPGSIPYDILIVAGGSNYSYFGHDDWSEHAAEVKSLESALVVRSRLLSAFEAAEAEPDPGPARGLVDLRRRGRGADRRRDGGPDRRACPRHSAPGLSNDRPTHGSHLARRGGRSRAHELSRLAVGEGGAVAATARRDRAHRPPGGRRRRPMA